MTSVQALPLDVDLHGFCVYARAYIYLAARARARAIIDIGPPSPRVYHVCARVTDRSQPSQHVLHLQDSLLLGRESLRWPSKFHEGDSNLH